MNRLRKHIVIFFSITISLVILVSTSGFTIYKHHCNHNHTNNYSLFTPSAKCTMHAPKPEVKSCCDTKEVNTCDTPNAEKDCCSDHTQVVRLDTKTLINNSTLVLKPIETASILAPMGFHNIQFEIAQTAILIHEFTESPPPLTTPEYLSLIQVYTI